MIKVQHRWFNNLKKEDINCAAFRMEKDEFTGMILMYNAYCRRLSKSYNIICIN